MVGHDGRPWLARRSLALCLLLLFDLTTLVYSQCEKEINDDVCPQREGFDKDCEQRCQLEYPHRLSSGCFLRSTGTLLSFFGIRSFICKCLLPDQFCMVGSTNQPNLRRSFSVDDLASHSTLVPLMANAVCVKPTIASLSCRDEFGEYACAWQRSYGGDWFVAQPHAPMPFVPGEEPSQRYLVGVAKGGNGVLQLDTCPELCSVDTVNVTAKIWRGPWVNAELCFREEDATLCAPLRISNGRAMNEVIPQTSRFQISIKFTNVSDGDVVLIDDLSAKFTECPTAIDEVQRIPKNVPKWAEISYAADKPVTIVSPFGASIRKPSKRQRSDSGGGADRKDTFPMKDALKRRLCRQGDCMTIVHRSVPLPHDQMCVGRLGLLRCREKCLYSGAEWKAARCVRLREYPFTKRCLCQVRRSPMRRIDGGHRDPEILRKDEKSPKQRNAPDFAGTRVARAKTPNQDDVARNEVTDDENVCLRSDSDQACDENCKKNGTDSFGRCRADGDQISCRCSHCMSSLCDFEKDHNCSWIDMHTINTNYGNFSIASKQNQSNRYGLSRLAAGSYSGVFRRGPFEGPVALSVDVYPTEGIDVRICVDNLQRCQTQKVTAKAWNRVKAKIRVEKTERIFLLFFNSANEDRTMAMDNVSLKSGPCTNV